MHSILGQFSKRIYNMLSDSSVWTSGQINENWNSTTDRIPKLGILSQPNQCSNSRQSIIGIAVSEMQDEG
ncbi:hypothetical protein M408DRAFT_328631 [Serendipita vermifera MAFF 305830]|uniref:Uncharacterized protein n=1 Tax=Serendipita vermifera MAFF 305830 TaxID=933852 RepID=A0A0C3BED0_SERVB|nr:hypothetical protein M408DRAFT_328631 [Serendipita vermifera MAFF 305830]